jgi:hypothetical protein
VPPAHALGLEALKVRAKIDEVEACVLSRQRDEAAAVVRHVLGEAEMLLGEGGRCEWIVDVERKC